MFGRFPGRLWREERGQTLAITAVMIAGILSVLALVLDLGVLRYAHAEAKRAADAGALAGASAFLDYVPAATAVTPAEDRAYEIALKNHIMRSLIDSSEVAVDVIVDSLKVRVYVRRLNVAMIFSRLFGIWQRDVSAYSEAIAQPASSATCVAPLAMPDWWGDVITDPEAEDTTGGANTIWDEREKWGFNTDEGDHYMRFNDPDVGDPTQETGLGSIMRNGMADAYGNSYLQDWGRPMVMKPQGPHDPHSPQEGWFFPIRLPSFQGAQDYRDAFTSCSPEQDVSIGDSLRVESGNMVGPTLDWVEDVIARDPLGVPDGYWDDPAADKALAKNSGRVIKIVMISPQQLADIQAQASGGNAYLAVNDVALYYVDGVRDNPGNNDDAVIGRFLEYASGGGGGPDTGSLVLSLRLIK